MRKFHAVVNDLIGGYDVSMWDKPVSEHVLGENGPVAERTIGSFMDEATATAVARSLNLMQYCACGDQAKDQPWMHRARDHGSWPY